MYRLKMIDFSYFLFCTNVNGYQEILQITRAQLERELSLEDIYRIQDLPAYNILDS